MRMTFAVRECIATPSPWRITLAAQRRAARCGRMNGTSQVSVRTAPVQKIAGTVRDRVSKVKRVSKVREIRTPNAVTEVFRRAGVSHDPRIKAFQQAQRDALQVGPNLKKSVFS